MRLFHFYLFSPGGNITLFLEHTALEATSIPAICDSAMTFMNAEQCAVADTDHDTLQMAGGEFCLNASRAFGALKDCVSCDQDSLAGNFSIPRKYTASVSGWPDPVVLEVSGHEPIWEVAIWLARKRLQPPQNTGEECLVHLPGISHILVRCESFPSRVETARLARATRIGHGLENMDAVGVVWWRPAGEAHEILPFVRVNSAGTAMLESSCGSGSLALALALEAQSGDSGFRVRQPQGGFLEIRLGPELAAISGPVALAARGKIWLPENAG